MAAKLRLRWLFAMLSLTAIVAPQSAGAGLCPVPGGGAISGRVTAAASGDGVAGAGLVLERIIDGFLTTVATTTAGPGGHYQFAGLFAGEYFVRTLSTALLVDEVWPDTACDQVCNPQDVGTPVTVVVGGWVEQIDFALAVGGRIEGVVFQADGTTPVPGARVEGYALGPVGTFGLGDVVAGADGAWSFDGLETRSYKVRASAPGLLAEVFPNNPCPMSCDVFPLGDPIAVTAGATTSGIDVALAAGATVYGTVTDSVAAPLEGAIVAVYASAGFPAVVALTDASGNWSAPEALPPGTYFARTGSDHLDELWNGLPCEPFCTVTGGTPIVVGTGPVSGIDFALEPLGAISGTILEAGTNLPLAGVLVVARSGGPFPGVATTAADGSYRIGGLAPGSYLVVAVDGAHAGEVYDDAGSCYDPLSCFPSGMATPIEVVGTAETAGVDFELEPGGVLSGVVVAAATNAPAAFSTVWVVRLDGGFETSAFSDSAGRFVVSGMPAGVSYRLFAEPPGGASLLGEVWEEIPCTPGSCDPGSGTPVPVGVEAPACVTFTLNGVQVGAGIAGTIAGESGPLAGLAVSVFDSSGGLVGSVTTDGSGAYLTTGALTLPAGSYFVLANGAAGYGSELYDNLPCEPTCTVTTGTPVVVVDGATTSGIDFALVLVEEPPPPPMPLIFLENCKPGGCIYHRGFEDSRINRSSIPDHQSVSLPEFDLPNDFWNELVACVRRAYRPFAVEVTDVDPGSAPHLEHVIAGHPTDIGLGSGVLGISPFTCGFIPNSISFTFPENHGSIPSQELLDAICWTVVHEIAHQHGLDHHAYLPDAMTYIEGCGPKLLPSRDVPCGEFSAEPCICGGATENSYARIRAVHGPSDLLFGDGFEIVEPGENCAWSQEVPPPVPPDPFAPARAPSFPRCGTLDSSNPGFRPRPPAPR